jgi:hypothetical protein
VVSGRADRYGRDNALDEDALQPSHSVNRHHGYCGNPRNNRDFKLGHYCTIAALDGPRKTRKLIGFPAFCAFAP